MSNQHPHHHVERAVDLLVFAPLGVAMFAKDTVPTFLRMFVARGHTELEQRRKELRDQAGQYKTIGQLAVKYGGPEVKRQAGATVDGVRRKAEETIAGIAVPRVPLPKAGGPARGPEDRSRPARRPDAPAPPETPRGNGRAAPPTSDEPAPALALPIPGYDQLSASQVVERLEGLAPEELAVVREYESEHRGRNTILGKITQLTS